MSPATQFMYAAAALTCQIWANDRRVAKVGRVVAILASAYYACRLVASW